MEEYAERVASSVVILGYFDKYLIALKNSPDNKHTLKMSQWRNRERGKGRVMVREARHTPRCTGKLPKIQIKHELIRSRSVLFHQMGLQTSNCTVHEERKAGQCYSKETIHELT